MLDMELSLLTIFITSSIINLHLLHSKDNEVDWLICKNKVFVLV